MKKNLFSKLSATEERLIRSLSTPSKIQDYLISIPTNDERAGETCMSPRRVMRERKAHCVEGAMFAALALRYHGHPPLVVDLTTSKHDLDHVIAVFKLRNSWGALSKTNHAVLRYREPVYKTIRELVMSYFHEYFLNNGIKTLRSYSMPVNLSRFDRDDWMTSEKDLWQIPTYLADIPHRTILTQTQLKELRRADPLERRAGMLVEKPTKIKKHR